MATCVAPYDTPAGRAWDRNIGLRDGTSVNVSANGSVDGYVFARYPDGATRHITTHRDYVYPHDIRRDRDSRTLWIVNSGWAAGIWREAHLYQYDLPSRILVRDLDVDPDDLPDPCPPDTQPPPSPTTL